jgi:hypothetical protein
MKLSALLIASLAAASATSAFAQTPPYVTVRNITYAGSGCPAGSVAQNLSPDLQAFTLLFDSFVAEGGPGIPFSEKRKNCQINVDLAFPNGWSYTIFDVDYRGYMSLESGTTGEQKSTYYFQGDSRQVPLSTKYYGPRDGDYHIRDTLALNAVVWSPCGATRSVNVNAQVRVDTGSNRNARALLTLDSIDGVVKHIYGIRWRRC